MKIKVISAGAGSGKTYRLMNELSGVLGRGVGVGSIMATTFTNKAAAELRERVMAKLLESGQREQAAALGHALIGTVHSLGMTLMGRFALEIGASPDQRVIPDGLRERLFNKAIEDLLDEATIRQIDKLYDKLLPGNKMDDKSELPWKKDIQALSDQMRLMRLDRAQVSQSLERSLAGMRRLLGPTFDDTQRFGADAMQALLDEALGQRHAGDMTGATDKAVEGTENLIKNLRDNRLVTWAEWISTSKKLESVSKKSTEAFAPLMIRMQEIVGHPDLLKDIETYITRLFNLSFDALEHYKNYKNRHGLVDQNDMEERLYELTQNEAVVQVLREELKVLLVDEFQDTNPMQLAIFLRLSGLAEEAIWVGDPKQSIYGFRGSDPRIMAAVIEAIGGVKPENILPDSYRSRRDIVNFCNAVFTRSFNTMAADQVSLNHVRGDLAGQTSAVQHWHYTVEVKNKAHRSAVYADLVARLLARQLIVKPKEESNTRAARAGDICILCRSNADCREIAQALNAIGIAATAPREGLLSTPEVTLVKAALHYLYDKRDTLAMAEWHVLGLGLSPESVANNRLREQAGIEGTPLLDDAEALRMIDDMRQYKSRLSMSELLHLLLNKLDIRSIVAAWPDAPQRLINIEGLVRLVSQFEDECNGLRRPASLDGLLVWLDNLKGKKSDEQLSSGMGTAVQVMTYHKSKGLEFPIAIMASLEKESEQRVFGFAVEADETSFSIDQPLAGVWLRYWLNPFAKSKCYAFNERVEQSPESRVALAGTRAEATRLLYVGLTRARDYLILPTFVKPTPDWLLHTYDETGINNPFDSNHSPVTWRNEVVPIEHITVAELLDESDDLQPNEPHYFVPSIGLQKHASMFLSDNDCLLKTNLKADKTISFKPFALPEGIENGADKVLIRLKAVRANQTLAFWSKRLDAESNPLPDTQLVAADFIRWSQCIADQKWVQLIPDFALNLQQGNQVWQRDMDLAAIDDRGAITLIKCTTETLDPERALLQNIALLERAVAVTQSQRPNNPVFGAVLMPWLGQLVLFV
jgi:ATP-dependent helicase/nuclease subunit A